MFFACLNKLTCVVKPTANSCCHEQEHLILSSWKKSMHACAHYFDIHCLNATSNCCDVTIQFEVPRLFLLQPGNEANVCRCVHMCTCADLCPLRIIRVCMCVMFEKYVESWCVHVCLWCVLCVCLAFVWMYVHSCMFVQSVWRVQYVLCVCMCVNMGDEYEWAVCVEWANVSEQCVYVCVWWGWGECEWAVCVWVWRGVNMNKQCMRVSVQYMYTTLPYISLHTEDMYNVEVVHWIVLCYHPYLVSLLFADLLSLTFNVSSVLHKIAGYLLSLTLNFFFSIA